MIFETDNTIKREPDGCVSVTSTTVLPPCAEMVKNFRLTGDDKCLLDKVMNPEDASNFIIELATNPPIRPIIKDETILKELETNPKYKQPLKYIRSLMNLIMKINQCQNYNGLAI